MADHTQARDEDRGTLRCATVCEQSAMGTGTTLLCGACVAQREHSGWVRGWMRTAASDGHVSTQRTQRTPFVRRLEQHLQHHWWLPTGGGGMGLVWLWRELAVNRVAQRDVK